MPLTHVKEYEDKYTYFQSCLKKDTCKALPLQTFLPYCTREDPVFFRILGSPYDKCMDPA